MQIHRLGWRLSDAEKFKLGNVPQRSGGRGGGGGAGSLKEKRVEQEVPVVEMLKLGGQDHCVGWWCSASKNSTELDRWRRSIDKDACNLVVLISRGSALQRRVDQ